MNGTTYCPKCFKATKPYPHGTDSADYPAHVPNGDGTYTVHRQRSVYTDSQNRDCAWQRRDHAERIVRLTTGNYTGDVDEHEVAKVLASI